MPKRTKKSQHAAAATRKGSVQRVVGAQMKIHEDGTASFHVRGYDFRWADIPIAVNGYLFAPVRPNSKVSPSVKPKREAALVAPHGWAARLQELKHRQTEDGLRRCDEMLTAAGVPEWVMNSENDNVPSNSTPARLRWYLARRKDIKPGEVDQKLQREMRKWLDCVAQHK